MKKKLFSALLMLLVFKASSQAQIAYNTHSSTPVHVKPTTSKNITTSKKHRKAKSAMKVEFVDLTNAPDSILKKTATASKRIASLFVASLGKKPSDSTYDVHTWTSYKSLVIGSKAQVRIDMSCTLTKNAKNSRKPPATRYTITYQADVNIFKIIYDSYTHKAKVTYNESHWPGFMHSDKTPSQADLDKDINAFLDHVINDEIVLH